MKQTAKPTGRTKRIAVNLLSLLCVFLFMASAAMIQSGRILGHDIKASSLSEITSSGDTIRINTTDAGHDIMGYGGPVPLEITLVDGRIDRVEALPNAETPGFFNRVTEKGLLESWNGMTPDEAVRANVDGVTGATFSSRAVIANLKAGLKQYKGSAPEAEVTSADRHDVKFFITLAVLIAAMSVPLFLKNNRYRTIQQLLNTAVLGFWAGTFINYTLMLKTVANGLTVSASVTTVLLLVAAFIYPLFGKEGYYCSWVCPLGSIQELALKCNRGKRLHLSPGTVKALSMMRMILWGTLMLCLWTGLWLSWIDYELFTAFLVKEAATGVLVAGGIFIILSVWIPRPYCHFVCPTGTLLRMSQKIDTK